MVDIIRDLVQRLVSNHTDVKGKSSWPLADIWDGAGGGSRLDYLKDVITANPFTAMKIPLQQSWGNGRGSRQLGRLRGADVCFDLSL